MSFSRIHLHGLPSDVAIHLLARPGVIRPMNESWQGRLVDLVG